MYGERFHFSCQGAPALAVFYLRRGDITHTGIFHSVGAVLHILDLTWHERLRSAPHTGDIPCAIPELEPEEVNDVTGLCRLIHTRHTNSRNTGGFRIPTAFRLGRTTRFSQVTGEMLLGDGYGFTCSTFVLSVFESAYVQLINLTDWPARPDDNARHNDLLALMQNGAPGIPPAAPAHVATIAAELPCIRVRPEEAAAACLAASLPADYATAERGGRWIQDVLTPGAQKAWI